MLLLILASLALADPWSRGAAAQLAESVVLVLESEEGELVTDVVSFVDEVFLNVADCSPK